MTGLVGPFADLLLLLMIPAVIAFLTHSALRYRMSRTSYRGIRFGYRGNRQDFIIKYYKWFFLTVITLGIYSFWFSMNERRYIHKNIRYGDVEFSNDCYGGEWFLLNLKGYLLSIITLGIYSFWWQADIFNYYINNLKMKKGAQSITCYSTATGGGFFELIVINFLIVIFTLGIGAAWAEVRVHRFICDNIKMEGDINIDKIQQTEEEYKDAYGEEGMGILDLEI